MENQDNKTTKVNILRLVKRVFIVLFILTALTAGGVIYLHYMTVPVSQELEAVTFSKVMKMGTASPVYIDTSREVTLTAVGDVMVHRAQMLRAYDSETDTFDFDKAFAYMGDTLSAADYTIGNLETTIAGRNNGVNPVFHGYSDYPQFNSPESLVDALKNSGVDFLGTANNHSIDSKAKGIVATLDYLDKMGIPHTGTARSEEEQEKLCIVEINEIKFGICAFTYATNGLPIPSDQPYLVNTLNEYKEDKMEAMCQQVRDLRKAGADFVLVLAHWGVEYKTVPSSYQEKLADRLFNAGADVIFGSHPHVVQPMEIRRLANADGSTRIGVCIYSLGNFISSQTNKAGPDKDLGLMMNVSFYKNKDEKKLQSVAVTPTCVYWSDDTIGVVPVEYALENEDKYPLINEQGWNRIRYAHDRIISVVTNRYGLDYELKDKWYEIKIP